jgi:hypothetical protein
MRLEEEVFLFLLRLEDSRPVVDLSNQEARYALSRSEKAESTSSSTTYETANLVAARLTN